MKKFNTLNEEINRIKQLLNVDNMLNEQDISRKSTIFTSESSKQVYGDFIKKYIKDNLPNLTNDLKLSNRIQILKNFMNNDSEINNTQPIQYFRKLGYKNNDPKIKDFQSELGISKIKSQDSEGNFIDGDFGVATVKVSLQVYIDQQTELLKSRGDKPYKDLLPTSSDIQAAKQVKTVIEPTKTQKQNIHSTDKTQQIDIGTQSTK